jgi:hypothetical protein
MPEAKEGVRSQESGVRRTAFLIQIRERIHPDSEVHAFFNRSNESCGAGL